MNRFIQIRVSRWYFVAAVLLPGMTEAACFGFGRDAHKAEARRVACDLAASMVPA
jgi:hypothetical protein